MISKHNKKGNLFHTKAFTLAEVLIVLGIVGIVASMTIPTLMNKTNNAEMATGFKKFMSISSAAITLLKNDNGGSLANIYTDANTALDGLCTQLKCIKK